MFLSSFLLVHTSTSTSSHCCDIFRHVTYSFKNIKDRGISIAKTSRQELHNVSSKNFQGQFSFIPYVDSPRWQMLYSGEPVSGIRAEMAFHVRLSASRNLKITAARHSECSHIATSARNKRSEGEKAFKNTHQPLQKTSTFAPRRGGRIPIGER